MLLIDGVKYAEWTPQREVEDFEPIIREHAKDIFGEESEYFDLKIRLESEYGKGSVPDGFVVVFGGSPCWHIVEVELSTHDWHRHIVEQHSRFIMAIKKAETRNKIVRSIYGEIANDDSRKQRLKEATKSDEIYPFLDEVISRPPVLTIIVEKPVRGLDETLKALSRDTISDIKILEFQTFVQEGVGLGIHAHLFEPLYPGEESKERFESAIVDEKGRLEVSSLEYILRADDIVNKRFFLEKEEVRRFFPGPKIEFVVVADSEKYEEVYLSEQKTPRIRGIYKWFRAHPELKEGDKVVFEVVELMKKYRLRKA